MPTDRLDLLEPPGRCSGCWPHDGAVAGGAVACSFSRNCCWQILVRGDAGARAVGATAAADVGFAGSVRRRAPRCELPGQTTAPTLTLPATSSPPRLKLVAVRSIGRQSHHKCYPSCSSFLDRRAFTQPPRQHDRRQRPDPNHSRITPRSNPHSVRRTAGARPIAISCLGAFWTPADRARRCHCIHRHPKTCTLAEVDRFIRSPRRRARARSATV